MTTENLEQVTSSAFIDQLRSYDCKIVFFIEYVPTESGTEHLAFDDNHVRLMEDTLERRRQEYEDIIFSVQAIKMDWHFLLFCSQLIVSLQ